MANLFNKGEWKNFKNANGKNIDYEKLPKEIKQVLALIDAGVSSIGTSLGTTLIKEFRFLSNKP